MTPDQYKAAIADLGLTHKQAGEFLGRTERHSYNWASGKYTVPKAVDMLLVLMRHYGLKPSAFKWK